MVEKTLLEICLDSLESAMAAQNGGAGRVELCANLAEGGTTPSAGLIEVVRNYISIPLHVMIRPRPGDFCYSEMELEIMNRDILLAKKLGADGIVLGVLRPDRTVDAERLEAFLQLARPMKMTFHRAFDAVNDPLAALDDLIGVGVDRILTSGKCPTAFEGVELIAELVRLGNDRLVIMPGSGINSENIQTLMEKTRAKEFHVGRAVHSTLEQMDANPDFSFGSRTVVDAEKVRIMKGRILDVNSVS